MTRPTAALLAAGVVGLLLFPGEVQADLMVATWERVLFILPVVILIELLVFAALNAAFRLRIPFARILRIVVVANLVSSIPGFYLPVEFRTEIEGQISKLWIYLVGSVFLELIMYRVLVRRVAFARLLVICLAGNVASYALFTPYLLEVSKPKNPRGRAISNLETFRAALAQFSADQDDACLPPTEAIGEDLTKLRDTLGSYGLTFPQELKKLHWESLNYLRDDRDCALYTITVRMADGDRTVIKAFTNGICCDDQAPTGPNCANFMKNLATCSQLLQSNLK